MWLEARQELTVLTQLWMLVEEIALTADIKSNAWRQFMDKFGVDADKITHASSTTRKANKATLYTAVVVFFFAKGTLEAANGRLDRNLGPPRR